MSYSTIFFDLDDTLWDTAGNNRDAMKEIYDYYSFDKYYETFDDFYAVYLPCNLQLWSAYEKKEVSKDDLMYLRFYIPFGHTNNMTVEKAFEINEEYLQRTALKSKVVSGALKLLEELKPYFHLHILSNGFKEVQYKKMESSGLVPFFEKIILSDDIGVNKPDPVIFNYALKIVSAKSEDSIMIGDNWNSDIIGAKQSDIDQIWFNPSSNKEKGFVPTYIVKSLSEVKDILI